MLSSAVGKATRAVIFTGRRWGEYQPKDGEQPRPEARSVDTEWLSDHRVLSNDRPCAGIQRRGFFSCSTSKVRPEFEDPV